MKPEKLLPGRNYGSVPHLLGSKLGEHDNYLHEGQDAIIRRGGRDRHDRLYVTVKLDGTNVGILKKDGRLHSLQRKGYACTSSPYEMHHEFDRWVQSREDRFMEMLAEGERLVGEWLWQASGIRYAISGEPFAAFDLFPPEGPRLSWPDTLARCLAHNVQTPLAYPTDKLTDEDIAAAMDYFSGPAGPVEPIGEAHEGLVARIERKGVYDFMAKWVRADFVPGKYLPGVRGNTDGDVVLNVLR